MSYDRDSGPVIYRSRLRKTLKRVISLIEDSEVIRRILRHLGLWAPHNPRKGFTDRLRPPCRDHLQTP